MISYNITTGDTLTKVFQRIPGGLQNINQVSKTHFNRCWQWAHYWEKPQNQANKLDFPVLPCAAVGPGHILAERHFVILLTTLVLTLPLSLYRNIERLGKVRLAGSVAGPDGSSRMAPAHEHPCVSAGVLPVHGADLLHSHSCGHQSRDARAPNVRMSIVQTPTRFFFFLSPFMLQNHWVPCGWINM